MRSGFVLIVRAIFLMQSVFHWISQYGYAGLFCLLMLGILGLPVPDETLLTFCGYLIWKGRLNPLFAFLSALGGSACGISLSYVLGRTYGHKVAYGYGKYIGLNAERLARVHRWFDRMGSWLLAVGYFIPGVRHFSALVAGMSELRYATFALFAYSGAAVWVAFFLCLGFLVGENWRRASSLVERYALLLSAVCLVLAAAWWLVRRELRKRQRNTVRK